MERPSFWPLTATALFMFAMLAISGGVWYGDLDLLETFDPGTPAAGRDPQFTRLLPAPSAISERVSTGFQATQSAGDPKSIVPAAPQSLTQSRPARDKVPLAIAPAAAELEPQTIREQSTPISAIDPLATPEIAVSPAAAEPIDGVRLRPPSSMTQPRPTRPLDSKPDLERNASHLLSPAITARRNEEPSGTDRDDLLKLRGPALSTQTPAAAPDTSTNAGNKSGLPNIQPIPTPGRSDDTAEGPDRRSGAADSSDDVESSRPPIKATSAQVFWPEPKSLKELLKPLGEIESMHDWCRITGEILDQLPAIQRLPNSALETRLDDLEAQAAELWALAGEWARDSNSLDSMRHAATASRISYEFHRRVEIWREINQLARECESRATSAPASASAKNVNFSRWNFENVHPQWREYLKLDELQSGDADRVASVRRTLGRLSSATMDRSQKQYVESVLPAPWSKELREAASHEIDFRELLHDIETFHQRENGFTAHQINDQFQNALWSNQPAYHQLAATLNNHYRNANLRLTISKDLLNRLVTQPSEFDEPVRDSILGATVTGKSRVSNQLSIELIPDPERWNITLNTNGKILSTTQAERDGFVFHTVGNTDVQGSKRIALSYDGFRSEAPDVQAVMDQQVVGLHSPFDAVPIFGWTARRIAQRRQQASAPVANQLARNKIRSRVQQRIDQEVGDAVDTARQRLLEDFIQPMVAADLEPQAVELSTSSSELTLRYRLAGFDQLAANTPRPMTDANSAVSFQVHQSVLNNVIERLDLAGETFSIESLQAHLRSRLPLNQLPAANPAVETRNVSMQFAPYDPIRIDFANGQFQLALSFKHFQIGDGDGWRNVTVRTQYVPEFDGVQLVLKQTGGVRGSGRRIPVREELAIGAIFNHVLQDEYRWSVIPPESLARFQQLKIRLDHFVVSDGWVSVAYENAGSPVNSDRLGLRRINEFRR